MCTRPFKAFPIPGKKTKNGKQAYIIRDLDTPHVEINKFVVSDYILIPCGSCKECKLQYSKQWAIRCAAEAYCYPHNYNYFVTLTYNNENLPVCTWTDPITGEYIGVNPTLSKSDLQEFMHSLRDYFRYHFNFDGIRFFGCGEYGSKGRPHYHLLLFNCPLFLLRDFPAPGNFHSVSDLGNRLYNSDILTNIWNKGFVLFSEFTVDTAAYTARYTLKKANLPGESFLNILRFRAKTDARFREYYRKVIDYNFKRKSALSQISEIKHLPDYQINKSLYADRIDELYSLADQYAISRPDGQQFEFLAMSTRPGIGKPYFDKHFPEIYKNDELFVTGKRSRPPRYFDNLLEVIDKDLHSKVKLDRQEIELFKRQLIEDNFNLDTWSDVFKLKQDIVDDLSNIYKRGDM